jgi:hypothetical protein
MRPGSFVLWFEVELITELCERKTLRKNIDSEEGQL